MVTNLDVYEAIEEYIGDCNELVKWEEWDRLYTPFFNRMYWPGELYRSDTEDVELTSATSQRLLLCGHNQEMLSLSEELVNVDVELEASFCEW